MLASFLYAMDIGGSGREVVGMVLGRLCVHGKSASIDGYLEIHVCIFRRLKTCSMLFTYIIYL